MTILTHTVIGSLVGAGFPNLAVAAFFGMASHFIFDVIPHNDYLYYFFRPSKNPYTSVTSKIILAVTAAYLLFIVLFMPRPQAVSSLVGAIFAIVPDALTGLWTTLGKAPSLFDRFHGLTHHRWTLAELFYNHAHPENKLLRVESGGEGFIKMAPTNSARLGWLVEMSLELIILGLSLTKLWIKF